MYSLPQEIEVWYIIPAIRKELSRVLTKEYGLTLEKTGSILGISKSAVSQYLNKKRADKIKLAIKVKKEIAKSAKILVKDNTKAVEEIMRILNLMKTWKCCCEVCKKFNKGIISQCKLKPIKTGEFK